MSGEREERGRGRGGFTLVEILVAFVITGILSIAIYALFSTTSSSLREADSLADTLDGTRFALEQLRSDFEAAGALGTPDAYNDNCSDAVPPCVAPDPQEGEINDRRFVGLASYGSSGGGEESWQDYAEFVMADSVWGAEGNVGEDGQRPQFDGIIVMGAIDIPFTFEIGFQRDQTERTPEIAADQRGLWKLVRQNIFDTSVTEPTYDDTQVDQILGVGNEGDNRILRIMDLKGGLQFAGVAAGGLEASGTGGPMTVDLDSDHDLHTSQAGQTSGGSAGGGVDYGLDPVSQQDDKRYPAAFLDVYWYHVVPDPTQTEGEETNYLLIRERLDGKDVMDNLAGNNWQNYYPEGDVVAGTEVVMADRVVDFQIWFDCTDGSGNGNVDGNTWNVDWNPPVGNDEADHDCLNPSDPSPGEARLMHVRLSRRTDSERQELPANAFPQNSDDMQAFDLNPSFEGAARVYTSQVDFELPTFASRNITAGGP